MIVWENKTRAGHYRAEGGARPLSFDMTAGWLTARLDDFVIWGWTLHCDALGIEDLYLRLGPCTPGEAQIEAERIIREKLQEALGAMSPGPVHV